MEMARLLAFLACLGCGLGRIHADEAPYAAKAASSPRPCKAGNQELFYSPHPLLDAGTAAGFSDSLARQLREPLGELGYCLQEAGDYRAISDPSDTARHGDNLVLQIQAEAAAAGSGTVLVALLRARELARGKLAEAFSHPLVSFRYGPGEASSLSSILAKKISENLRSQYVADLLVRSHPAGASVRSSAGLQGTTPVEWVLPLGIVQVTLEKKGYMPLAREIDLSAPGRHAYDLQLSKRRFYHSPFIYPTLAAGAVSLIAFGLESHYYDEYRSLGPQDLKNRPGAFGNTFKTAKTYEAIAYTAMGLAWLNLTLCFTF
jgi:PEGA domain-containing protein